MKLRVLLSISTRRRADSCRALFKATQHHGQECKSRNQRETKGLFLAQVWAKGLDNENLPNSSCSRCHTCTPKYNSLKHWDCVEMFIVEQCRKYVRFMNVHRRCSSLLWFAVTLCFLSSFKCCRKSPRTNGVLLRRAAGNRHSTAGTSVPPTPYLGKQRRLPRRRKKIAVCAS